MRKRNRQIMMFKKIAVALAAVVLIVSATIGGTLAWLTAETSEVTNTFTVGDINIELKENDYVLSTDSLDSSKWQTEEDDYKVVPGATDPKNPTVFVKAGSEKCCLYALVKNALVVDTIIKDTDGKIESQTPYKNVATLNLNNTNNKWSEIAEYIDSGTKIVYTLYKYSDVVDASSSTEDIQVTPAIFESVTYSGTDITKANIESLDDTDANIVVWAYAHQSEYLSEDVNVDDNAIAWANTTAGLSNKIVKITTP